MGIVEKKKVVKKSDLTKRKNIHVATLKKVEEFLKKQNKPIFKSDIVKAINVDFNSVGIALENLKIKADEEGRVKLS